MVTRWEITKAVRASELSAHRGTGVDTRSDTSVFDGGGSRNELPHLRFRGREYGRDVSIVYYLQRADLAIKIGFTSNYPSRRQRLRRRHGPLNLVAWEVGSLQTEHTRHVQFAHLRIGPVAEWFRPEPDLVDHVLMLLALL